MDQGEEKEGEGMSLAEPAEIELDEAELNRRFTVTLDTPSYEELKSLCYRISGKIYRLGFKLSFEIRNTSYLFYIRDMSDRLITSTNISLSDESFTAKQITRRKTLEVEDELVFTVIAVDTHNPKDRGKGYALLLLIFSLSYLKILHPEYKYSVLDDATHTSALMKGNIYTNLGYGPRGDEFVQLDITNSGQIIPGNKEDTGIKPERVLYLDNINDIDHLRNFIRAANSSLTSRKLLSGGKLTKKNRSRTRSKGKKKNRKSKKYRKSRKY